MQYFIILTRLFFLSYDWCGRVTRDLLKSDRILYYFPICMCFGNEYFCVGRRTIMFNILTLIMITYQNNHLKITWGLIGDWCVKLWCLHIYFVLNYQGMMIFRQGFLLFIFLKYSSYSILYFEMVSILFFFRIKNLLSTQMILC